MTSVSLALADVVIVGLGPTGLVLAHALGRRGHQVVVIEREPAFSGDPRAVYTDDECMRIFQSVGIADAIEAKTMRETPIQLTRPDGTVLVQYMPRKRPFGWPVVSFFYQPYLEATLAEGLAQYPNVQILRGRELIDFTEIDGSVLVTHRTSASTTADPEIETRSLRTRYLVGADGGRSFVRSKLGIPMIGESFPEPWLVVDLETTDKAKNAHHLPYFSFVVDPARPTVICVQPEGYQRFEFRLLDKETKEELEAPATVRRLLAKWVDPDAFTVKRKLVYTFNALMAETWRKSRVFLAGDAAHMAPQFMGQGASSGIRDAANLGWKMDLVLRGVATEALLETYETERRGHAQAMIDVSVLLKNVVSATNPVKTKLRDFGLSLARATPKLSTWVKEGGFKPDPIYAKGSYFGLPRRGRKGPEGGLAPQPEIRRFDGSRARLDDVLGPDLSVVGYATDPRTHLSAEARATLDRWNARYATLYRYGGRPQGLLGAPHAAPEGLVEIEDFSGEMITWFEDAGFTQTDAAVAIFRPDKFTFALVAPGELDAAVRMLRSASAVAR